MSEVIRILTEEIVVYTEKPERLPTDVLKLSAGPWPPNHAQYGWGAQPSKPLHAPIRP
jgi:hypothetical protein